MIDFSNLLADMGFFPGSGAPNQPAPMYGSGPLPPDQPVPLWQLQRGGS